MTPPLLGVLGHPVSHSRSPAMMGAALAELGLDWRYLPLPVPPERFEEVVRALPASGYHGANVTLPHKVAALELADDATPAAREIGAANTLTFAGGRIEADNTDAGGLMEALAGAGVRARGARAVVLGAGGAGRAAAWALHRAGATVHVWNRTSERAAELGDALGVTTVGLGAPGAGTLADLGLAGLDPPAVVVDLVYGQGGTPVERWARTGGATVVDGLEILVRQGALSLAGWTGREPPLDAMRAAAQAAG